MVMDGRSFQEPPGHLSVDFVAKTSKKMTRLGLSTGEDGESLRRGDGVVSRDNFFPPAAVHLLDGRGRFIRMYQSGQLESNSTRTERSSSATVGPYLMMPPNSWCS